MSPRTKRRLTARLIAFAFVLLAGALLAVLAAGIPSVGAVLDSRTTGWVMLVLLFASWEFEYWQGYRHGKYDGAAEQAEAFDAYVERMEPRKADDART